MARIAGVDLPRDKRVVIGLTYIFGIGRSTAEKIIEICGIDPNTRVRDLTEDQANQIREIIEKQFLVEGDLRREVNMNIKRLRISAATAACVTAEDFLFADSALRPTRERVRVQNALQVREDRLD